MEQYEQRRRHNRAISDNVSAKAIAMDTQIITQPSTDISKLNKTEKRFYDVLRGKYEWVGVQCITLKLADDTRYTPDFFSIDAGQLVAFEVKGFWRDDAKVKIKVAARQFPFIRFVVAELTKNGFMRTPVKP